jgi:hypothetical protein
MALKHLQKHAFADGAGERSGTRTGLDQLDVQPIVVPPLPPAGGGPWNMGSAPAGVAYMMTLWFRSHGGTFIACAKIGPRAPGGSINTVSAIVRSLH